MASPVKNILFFDFETYYAADYTLRKMTIPQYILDPRFETICCSAAVNNGPSTLVDGPDFGEWLAQYDPATTATVTFNALFDCSILAWVYGWTPALMLDSMNMARALRGDVLPRFNLDTVAEALGVGTKGKTILKVQGMRRQDIISQGLWKEFGDYCNNDNDLSREIFKKLSPEFLPAERRLMDLVIRTTVQPRFMLDRNLLASHLHDVRMAKIKLLNDCGAMLTYSATPEQVKSEVTRIGLMSQAGFTKALEAAGVTVEYKTSPATGEMIPAFAKTDDFMARLQEDLDPKVQALVCARVGVKSTIEETRTEKLLAIADLPWGHYRDGNPRLYSGGEMPIPLRYAGAHTHRLSGEWKLNMQNLPRGSKLRKALIPPPGMSVVAGDLAQIEARLVAWLAGCELLLEEFRKPNGDPYSAFASIIFGTPINRQYKDPVTGKQPHFVQGFIGKTGILGLGFGAGNDKFYTMVIKLGHLMGIDLTSVGFDEELAKSTVWGYRNKYFQIPALWKKLDFAVARSWSVRGGGYMNVGPVTIEYGRIKGPGDLTLLYGSPYLDTDTGDYMFKYGFKHHKMYGAKLLENIIQFLARIIIMNAALRLDCRGYRFVLQAHDELVFIVPDADVDNAKKIIYEELCRPPSWGKDIPLNAEVKSGKSYGECK
jgi:DNA polymerase